MQTASQTIGCFLNFTQNGEDLNHAFAIAFKTICAVGKEFIAFDQDDLIGKNIVWTAGLNLRLW